MKYLLSNIPFFTTLGVIALALWLVFFSRFAALEYKKALCNEICFCFLLCILTFAGDCVIFRKNIFETSLNFARLHGYFWGTFVAITSYLFMMLAFTGIFTCLRAIPSAGKILMWLTWCAFTIPTRLYYLVTGLMPSSMDIISLFTVKLYTTMDTLSTFLNVNNILAACLPNVIAIIVLSVVFRKTHAKSQRTAAFLAGGLLFAAYCINPKGSSELRDSMGYSLKVLRETISGTTRIFIPREDFTADKIQDRPANNIVLILDESIRGDYLSINNPDIDTTPALAKYFQDYPDNIFNYGIMLSTATTSFASRITLMTALERIPDQNLDEFKKPTIFDAAKANHYRTILINIQGDLPDGIFREQDMKKDDEVYLSGSDFRDVAGNGDMNAAAFLHKRLAEETGLFVFLEKLGAHVPYQKRYPASDSKHNIYTPCLEIDEWYSVPKRREIINSYKNVLRFNIDGFFRHLLGDDPLSLKDCTILYTSDHGQSFMEYGQLESHSTTYLEQALVPFFVFSTDSWVLDRLKRPQDLKCPLHHMNITPTLRALLCKDEDYDSGGYSSLVSGKFRKPELKYIMRGSPAECEVSENIPTDSEERIILPTEKYMY